MGILKLTFFRVRQTKSYLVRRQWIDVKFQGCHGNAKDTRLHLKLKKIDSRVKPKVLNDEKR